MAQQVFSLNLYCDQCKKHTTIQYHEQEKIACMTCGKPVSITGFQMWIE